jgi:hypothetical protein
MAAGFVDADRVAKALVPTPNDFYRAEFLKHRACLERQREYFSERAITAADGAIALVLNRLDHLCAKDNASQVIGQLLKTFDLVTGLSAWSEPKQLH